MCNIKEVEGMQLVEASKLVATQIEEMVNECKEKDKMHETAENLQELLEKLSEVRKNARLLFLVTNIRFENISKDIKIKMLESEG